MKLLSGATSAPETLAIRFREVSDLSMDRLGGGLSEVLIIATKNGEDEKSGRQLYRIHDLRWRCLSFNCSGWSLLAEAG